MTKSNGKKVVIIYFSATGNCQKIANDIASNFEGTATLIDISQRLNQNLALPSCDILFVVLPVFSQLCPTPVLKFLKKLHFDGAVVPCVCYGGVSAGRALKQLFNVLKSNGAVVLAASEIVCKHTFDKPTDFEKLASRQSMTTNQLCRKAVQCFEEQVYLKKIPVQHFNPLAVVFPKVRARLGIKLKCVDKAVCENCKKCIENCPFGAVKQNLKTNRKCQRCGVCVKRCPHQNKQIHLHGVLQKYLKKYVDTSKDSRIF